MAVVGDGLAVRADDPWDIGDELLSAAGSLVKKSIDDSERYLVEKIRGMMRGLADRDDAATALTWAIRLSAS